MLKRILISAFAAMTSIVLAVEAAEVKKITAADALGFRVSFDGTTAAEVAGGRKTANEIRGKEAYADGINGGKALISGTSGAIAIYDFKDNVDFDRPGTMLLWFKANTDWHKNPPPFIVYFGWGDSRGLLHMRVSRQPDKACLCRRPAELWLYHFTNRRNYTLIAQPPALSKLCQGWHMIALAWENEHVSMSYDGMPFRTYKIERALANADFANVTRFAVGQNISEFLIDEFRIYKKKLSDDELLEIWEQGNAM